MTSKRMCRKCGGYIPYRKTVDGITHNLQNRKFCLMCSPYGGRNTKSDDPSRPNRRGKVYAEWSEESKERSRKNLYKRGITRKKELVLKAGGKCIKCGYDKCIDALVFHHRKNNNKLFGLTLNNLWSKNMKTIWNEFKKCDLFCSNCHIELHRKQRDKDPTNYRNVLNINVNSDI